MTTMVIVNDYSNDRRWQITFSGPDFDKIVEHWEDTDRLLHELQPLAPFAGRERWCDLDPTHWRVLIMRGLTMVAALPDEDKANERHPVVESLNFTITGLIHCIQMRTESKVELMHINRVTQNEVVYDYWACLNMALELPRKVGGLRVIVSNE